jgi:wobble nucleotide-excising tRNase
MDGNKFTIKLKVSNIGPHYDDNQIAFSKEVNSNKAIFFAANGTGKSFLSRLFRLTAHEKQAQFADELLTIEKPSGSMSFQIIEKELLISIKRGKVPTVQNDTGLIFHVFNSDFVEENIKPNNYAPNGNIEGYILGKTQIDLSEEKKQESAQRSYIKALSESIDKTIDEAKQEVRSKGVTANTAELTLFTRQAMIDNKDFGYLSSYDEIVAQLDTLSRVPESLADVPTPSFHLDLSFFEEVKTILLSAYPKSEWDEDFVVNYQAKRKFIESGLDISKDGDICPFCEQAYTEPALVLIRDYKLYRADKEAQLLAQIQGAMKAIISAVDALKEYANATNKSIIAITKLKEFFPSLTDVELSVIDVTDELVMPFKEIIEMLETKSGDMTLCFDKVQNSISQCTAVKKHFEKLHDENAITIFNVNKTKNDANGERLALRRNLCKAQFLLCQERVKPMLLEYDEKEKALSELQNSIAIKEQQARTSKRDKVYETFEAFLNRFFDGKYCLDKELFQIKFLGTNVEDKASYILSDGEKSIVAFCYYLATTHILITREEEYNKLFFIIDDPISSMDFHYVYAVAQSLREIKSIFGITAHERVWVFTHNIEFFSIIARNYILSEAFIMTPGKIDVLKYQLLLPYESHLKDVVHIACGIQTPSHTTGNSIRHILETVSRFEYPSKSIEKYIAENETLRNNACIFTLCQDLSHGNIRKQQPFSADVLIAACKAVVDFMKSKYQGQIDAVSSIAEKEEA